jgi:hypothetical protein
MPSTQNTTGQRGSGSGTVAHDQRDHIRGVARILHDAILHGSRTNADRLRGQAIEIAEQIGYPLFVGFELCFGQARHGLQRSVSRDG